MSVVVYTGLIIAFSMILAAGIAPNNPEAVMSAAGGAGLFCIIVYITWRALD